MWKPINSMTHPIQPTDCCVFSECVSVCLAGWLWHPWKSHTLRSLYLPGIEEWTKQFRSANAEQHKDSAKVQLPQQNVISVFWTISKRFWGRPCFVKFQTTHTNRERPSCFCQAFCCSCCRFCLLHIHYTCQVPLVLHLFPCFFFFPLWFYFASMLFSLNAIRAVRLLREGCFLLLQLACFFNWELK